MRQNSNWRQTEWRAQRGPEDEGRGRYERERGRQLGRRRRMTGRPTDSGPFRLQLSEGCRTTLAISTGHGIQRRADVKQSMRDRRQHPDCSMRATRAGSREEQPAASLCRASVRGQVERMSVSDACPFPPTSCLILSHSSLLAGRSCLSSLMHLQVGQPSDVVRTAERTGLDSAAARPTLFCRRRRPFSFDPDDDDDHHHHHLLHSSRLTSNELDHPCRPRRVREGGIVSPRRSCRELSSVRADALLVRTNPLLLLSPRLCP